jgi:hypothetical protein
MERQSEIAMQNLYSSLFLLIVGAGRFSFDALFKRNSPPLNKT